MNYFLKCPRCSTPWSSRAWEDYEHGYCMGAELEDPDCPNCGPAFTPTLEQLDYDPLFGWTPEPDVTGSERDDDLEAWEREPYDETDQDWISEE